MRRVVVFWAGICCVVAKTSCRGDSCANEEQADDSLMQTSHLGRSRLYKHRLPPQRAQAQSKARQPLVLESNLDELVWKLADEGLPHGALRHDASIDEFRAHVQQIFKRLVTETGLVKELTENELVAFKHRFATSMVNKRKDIKNEKEWLAVSGMVLESEKPLSTTALIDSLNTASLGFKAKMWKWLADETEASSIHRLGLLPARKGEKSVYRRGATVRRTEDLPESFRAEEKWPMCSDAILRIHNQGHCGSCWAFSGLAPVDARMCIVSNGTWNKPQDTLSRLQALSCSPFFDPELGNLTYFDGCMGGEPRWTLDMLAKGGMVSTNCLPYYITGEGVEHFQESERGPPCVTHCQQGYNVPMEKDTFVFPGIDNYDLLREVHGNEEAIAMMKTAMYTEGPVSFAFKVVRAFFPYAGGVWSACDGEERANHAVYAFGWGLYNDSENEELVEFIEALNSWGTHWGVNGTFRIHPVCICDVTIPGTINSTMINHEVEETNEYWPWDKPDECPVDADGCVTDLEGEDNYTSNEMCFSKQLNGKKLQIIEFDMEVGYDYLQVNGRRFSGSNETTLNVEVLTSLIVDENGIKFMSDQSVVGPGFKLCPLDPDENGNNTDSNDTDDANATNVSDANETEETNLTTTTDEPC